MSININDWGQPLTDSQVSGLLKDYRVNQSGDISCNTIGDICNSIINNPNLSDRAKLFYLDDFENRIIKSRIQTDEDALKFLNSLF